jgi:hypothetical protein
MQEIFAPTVKILSPRDGATSHRQLAALGLACSGDQQRPAARRLRALRRLRHQGVLGYIRATFGRPALQFDSAAGAIRRIHQTEVSSP